MTRGGRRASIALLLCCAAGASTELLAQSAPRPLSTGLRPGYQPVSLADEPASSGARMHVAVVGSVAAPATYLFSAPTTAARVLQAAGGLTADAGDNLLIVRQGRIHGPILLDSSDKELRAAGPLMDGDVLVFKARRGVRTALYQTLEPGAVGRRGVENAMTERATHVACIGLAPYPVVLPLPPGRATEQALLLELLRLTPQLAERSVRRVTDGSYTQDDGSLQDGTVLWFDPQLTATRALRPVEPLPLPRTSLVDEPAVPQPAVAPVPVTSADSPAPGAIASVPVEPPIRVAANGQLLAEPLPGFPFVVRDPAPTVFSPADSASGFVGAPVLRGGAPIDVTEAAAAVSSGVRSTPSRSLLTSAEFRSVSAATTPSTPPAGIRAPTVVQIPDATAAATLEGDAPIADRPFSALESPVDFSILGGVLLAAACCLGASYLWSREERRRSSNLAAPGKLTVPTQPVAALTPRAVPSPLQQLLDNALPVIEEPAALERLARMHGPVVGQRRLMIDAPHAQVAPPHFALSRAAVHQQRQQRYERHLAAASAVPTPAAVSPAASPSPSPSSQATFRYDVVQPEPSAPSTSAKGTRGVTQQGELLTRVLDSLRGEA